MLRKPVAAILLVLTPLHLAACAPAAYRIETHVFPGHQRDTLAVRQLSNESVRLRLRSGRSVRMDIRSIAGDTLYGTGYTVPVDSIAAVPLDSIAQLDIRRSDGAANLANGVASVYSGAMVAVSVVAVVVAVACWRWLKGPAQEVNGNRFRTR